MRVYQLFVRDPSIVEFVVEQGVKFVTRPGNVPGAAVPVPVPAGRLRSHPMGVPSLMGTSTAVVTTSKLAARFG